MLVHVYEYTIIVKSITNINDDGNMDMELVVPHHDFSTPKNLMHNIWTNVNHLSIDKLHEGIFIWPYQYHNITRATGEYKTVHHAGLLRSNVIHAGLVTKIGVTSVWRYGKTPLRIIRYI